MKKKKRAKKTTRHEIVVRVAPQIVAPTTEELAQPMQDGKALSIPKTWVSDKQIMRMVQKTPPQFVYERPGKGGQKWKYVSGGYVEKVLNYVFGFMWDFEVLEHGMMGEFIWVKGRLTVKDPKGNTITKTQFGRKEIAYKKDMKHVPEHMLDYGNDLKSAATDAMKKCASMLGIASDIYAPTEYKQESGVTPRESQTKELPPAQSTPQADGAMYHCLGLKGGGCPYGNEDIDEATYNYSMKMFKKPLCRECQKDK